MEYMIFNSYKLLLLVVLLNPLQKGFCNNNSQKFEINKIVPSNLNNKIINWDNFIIAHTWVKGTTGIIYFEKDLIKNPNKMCEDIKEQSWRLPMIDQESVEIARIKEIAPPSYTTQLNLDNFKFQLNIIAKKLKEKCVKINLAPVIDVGSRGYGTEDRIKNYTTVFAQVMRENNIVPTYKHFPGMGNTNETVYNNSLYSKWYKNIYGEGVVENATWSELNSRMNLFKDNNYNVVMLSIALFKNIDNKPIIFNQKVWNEAHRVQPNSLYIPDDLSELNLSDNDILWLFKHCDLLLYTSPQDIIKLKGVLQKLFVSGLISNQELREKMNRQNKWRRKNFLPLLPLN
jgi:hypothetical protein